MRSRTAAAVAVAVVCALAAACTSTSNRAEPVRTSAQPRTTAPEPAPAAARAEFGTKDSRIVRCVSIEAHVVPVAAQPPSTRDVVIGPLRWPGLKDQAQPGRTGFGTQRSDGWHYKTGVEIAAGASATVSVAPQARAKAGLEYGQQWGYSSAERVEFHACPKARTGYIGGFFVAGATGRICLPLDVRTGEAPPRRITVSLGAGKCPA